VIWTGPENLEAWKYAPLSGRESPQSSPVARKYSARPGPSKRTVALLRAPRGRPAGLPLWPGWKGMSSLHWLLERKARDAEASRATMVEAFLRAKQKVEKLTRKPERAADVAAAKMREAAGSHVARAGEARSPHAAMVQADGPRLAGEPSVHSPASGASRIVSPLLISEGLAGRSLPRLRQDALSSTSALAHGAAGQAGIVSPLLISPVSSPACEETRAAA